MISFFIQSCLSVKKKYHKLSLSDRGILDNFGFQEGGIANFNFTFPKTYKENVTILLLTNFEFSKFSQGNADEQNNCYNFSYSNYMQFLVNESLSNVSINISVHSVLNPIIIPCSKHDQDTYDLTTNFKNPSTNLDYRDIPSLNILIGFICVHFVLLIIWIVVSIYHHRNFNSIHTFLLCIYIIFICYLLLAEISLRQWVHSDDSTNWSLVYSIVLFLFEVSLFSTLVIAAGGWGILQVKPRIFDVIVIVLASILAFVMNIIFKYANSGQLGFLVFVFQLIGIFVLLWYMFQNVAESQLRIIAHLHLIKVTGIDPLSTPIYERFTLFSNFLILIVFDFLGLFLSAIITEFFNADNWVSDLCLNIFLSVILAGLLWLHRPRKSTIEKYIAKEPSFTNILSLINNESYTPIPGSHDDNNQLNISSVENSQALEKEVFYLEDLEDTAKQELETLRNIHERNQLPIWNEDISLPPEPIVKRKQVERNWCCNKKEEEHFPSFNQTSYYTNSIPE